MESQRTHHEKLNEAGKRTEQTVKQKVFITTSDASCNECREQIGGGAWLTLVENKRRLCLSCVDLDHLIFLSSGEAALTRRARKHSALATVVLSWSRARRQYERQGLLVDAQALEQTEAVRLAVIAHVRLSETEYDTLLASGCERWEERAQLEKRIARVLAQ